MQYRIAYLIIKADLYWNLNLIGKATFKYLERPASFYSVFRSFISHLIDHDQSMASFYSIFCSFISHLFDQKFE